MVNTANTGFEAGGTAEALYDTWVGIVVGVSHSLYFAKKITNDMLLPPLRLLGLAAKEEKVRLPEGETPELKVVGVGYGRTGTVSGIEPRKRDSCHHCIFSLLCFFLPQDNGFVLKNILTSSWVYVHIICLPKCSVRFTLLYPKYCPVPYAQARSITKYLLYFLQNS